MKKGSWALVLFLAVLLSSVLILPHLVPLSPKVGSDFFFSSNNPRFQYHKLISKLFPSDSQQLIVSAKGNIRTEDYFSRITAFSNTAALLPGVTSVKSLSSGPRNVKDAGESPLWKRLLISGDGLSSNILSFLGDVPPEIIIPKFEQLISLLETDDFELNLAGVPYVVEMIRRNLVHDLTVFSLVAFIVFGIVMVFIFHSVRIFLGTLVACVEACVITLLITGLCDIPIGILTVNLSTIVFVITLSHIIFITHNWRSLARKRSDESHFPTVLEAAKMTFSASFWCMATTLLGFLSLLFVQAKPLRELGLSGSVGTLVGIFSAYTLYPAFLILVRPPHKDIASGEGRPTRQVLLRRSGWIALLLILGASACAPGLHRLNTDPSLFSFFKKGSPLREGLEYIDQNGGSSPLEIVVRDAEGNKLDTNTTYKRMWGLQEALEKDPSVGSVISLPVLMAEGSRAPLAFLLNWQTLLNWMSKPQYNRIASSFITPDHVSGRFLLRMKESARTGSRIAVVQRIKNIVRDHHFIPELVGGLFLLQGELSRLVSTSLIYGLSRLIGLFIIIAFIVSRSIRTSIAMVLSLSLVPLVVFGLIGYARIPVDIISAPAVNIAIGMGIDSMIHMVSAVRRRRKKGIDPRTAWTQARVRLWKPVFSSMFIICAGFAIFGLSAFPPTQRFGIAIVIGTIVAATTTIFVLPVLSTFGTKKASK